MLYPPTEFRPGDDPQLHYYDAEGRIIEGGPVTTQRACELGIEL